MGAQVKHYQVTPMGTWAKTMELTAAAVATVGYGAEKM